MTVTNQQIGILMKETKKHNRVAAAAKAGMNIKAARKYLRLGKLPDELKKERTYLTRQCPFANHWQEMTLMMESAPELQATTILTYLIEKYPEHYSRRQLRSLQDKLKDWRAIHGKQQSVIFRQNILPAKQSQSDWTVMNELGICIASKPFPHLLFHFMLPYSGWETFMICYSESFDTLASGFEKAIWELGGTLPEHRTDNLSAATRKHGSSRQFTERWQELLDHYKIRPSRNNLGVSHENGSVEKSHDTFKQAVNQHLLLRGSRNFKDIASYEAFLTQIKERRNSSRRERVIEEVSMLGKLPERKWNAPVILSVRVNPSSTINILGVPYSVPSRLISYTLRAYVYPETIELYYGNKCLQSMTRITTGYSIDYRHIIDSLIRKPGAFFNYQYHQALFPGTIFREAYDRLMELHPSRGHKDYMKILQLAKIYGEVQVTIVLETLAKIKKEPSYDNMLPLLGISNLKEAYSVEVTKPNLAEYDSLHCFRALKPEVAQIITAAQIGCANTDTNTNINTQTKQIIVEAA